MSHAGATGQDVLKMSSGFWFYLGIVRPTDQATAAIEKIASYSQVPRGRDMPHHTKPHGEASGSVRRQKEQEKSTEMSFYCKVPRCQNIRKQQKIESMNDTQELR